MLTHEDVKSDEVTQAGLISLSKLLGKTIEDITCHVVEDEGRYYIQVDYITFFDALAVLELNGRRSEMFIEDSGHLLPNQDTLENIYVTYPGKPDYAG